MNWRIADLFVDAVIALGTGVLSVVLALAVRT